MSNSQEDIRNFILSDEFSRRCQIFCESIQEKLSSDFFTSVVIVHKGDPDASIIVSKVDYKMLAARIWYLAEHSGNEKMLPDIV